MSVALVKPLIQNLLTVASTSTTATSANFAIPIADSYSFYLNVTTASAGSCNVIFQTSIDGGTTYVNIPWQFAPIATTTGTFVLNTRSGLGNGFDTSLPTNNGALITDTLGAVALSACVDPAHMKIKYTITTGPYAFSVSMATWPRGSSANID